MDRAFLGRVGVVLALAASGCGGGSADDGAVRDTIDKALTTRDPHICTTLVTQTFMEQVSFQKGAAALRSCRRNVAAGASRSIDFVRVKTDGGRAEALFTPRGGTLDGQRVTVALRKDAGRWRLDRITKLDLVNRPKFDDAVRNGLRSPPLNLPLKQADCIVAGLQRRTDDQIESAFVKADATLVAEPAVRCSLASGLQKGGLTAGQSSCVVKGLGRRIPPVEIAQLLGVNLGTKRDV